MKIDSGENRQMLIRANALIQAVYRCSMTENKILLHALYDARQSGRPSLEFTTSDLAEFTGISATHAVFHKAAKDLDGLYVIDLDSNRTFADGIELIQKCTYSAGLFVIVFNPCVFKYLSNLQGSYTSIDIKEIQLLCNRGTSQNFTWRLYELLRTVTYKLESCDTDVLKISLSLAELKLRTGLVEKVNKELLAVINDHGLSQDTLNLAGDLYPLWSNFRAKVLNPAIADINKMADFGVSYTTQKGNNGKIVGLIFRLKRIKSEDKTFDTNTDKEVKTSKFDANAISAVRSFINEDLSDEAIESLIEIAQGDISRIRPQYYLMQEQIKGGNSIKNVVSWLKSAIKNDYAAASTISCIASGNKSPKDRHAAKFGFESNHYDFVELEKELLGE